MVVFAEKVSEPVPVKLTEAAEKVTELLNTMEPLIVLPPAVVTQVPQFRVRSPVSGPLVLTERDVGT